MLQKSEFIGKKICVVEATNPNLIGIEGVVVDETKSMITVLVKENNTNIEKKLIKTQVVIEFKDIEKRTIKPDEKRPHDRIKQKTKRYGKLHNLSKKLK